MHRFYKRIKLVFRYAGSNRNQFCKKYGYNYQTLQAYWNTDKLPPGNVLEDLAKEYNVSLDALVMGVGARPMEIENPMIRRITRSLETLDKDDLLRVEGALAMLGAINESGGETGAAKIDASDTNIDDVVKNESGWATLEEAEEDKTDL